MKLWNILAVAVLAAGCCAACYAQAGGPTAADLLASEALNYSQLDNQTFTYADLVQAKAEHLSDREIAQMVRIGEERGITLQEVQQQVDTGVTIDVVADNDGVSIADINDIGRQMDQIAEYESAYLATGHFAFRRNSIEHILAKAGKNRPMQ